MGFVTESRLSDSPYIEAVMHGHTEGEGSLIRPAESHWHMVFTRHDGSLHPIVVGSLPTAGVVSYGDGAEILWIKFKRGTYMPHLPARMLLDREVTLPGASSRSFWLKGSAWQFPDYENVETFVNRLVHEDMLVHDPVVSAVLEGHPHDLSPRTVRHRFLGVTGLSHNQIRQIERAQRAAALLEQGLPILDVVYQMGYFDQPHLTRSLKRWVGHTPAQIVRLNQPA